MSLSLTATLAQMPLEQRWRSQTAPVPVVVALVRRILDDTEQYLLINRAEGAYAGQWALVGGKWDFGEALAEAIAREVAEETGLNTQFVALRGVLSERVVPAEPGAMAAHFLLLLCDLLVLDGEAVEQSEGAVGWFRPAQIEKLHEDGAIIPSDYAMIATFAGATTVAPTVEIEMEAALLDSDQERPIRMKRFDHNASSNR